MAEVAAHMRRVPQSSPNCHAPAPEVVRYANRRAHTSPGAPKPLTTTLTTRMGGRDARRWCSPSSLPTLPLPLRPCRADISPMLRKAIEVHEEPLDQLARGLQDATVSVRRPSRSP